MLEGPDAFETLSEFGFDFVDASGLGGDVGDSGAYALTATAGSRFLRPPSSAFDGCRRKFFVDACVLTVLALDAARDAPGPDNENSGILDPGEAVSDISDPLLSIIVDIGDGRGEFSFEGGGDCATPP